jgi:hypothetical protein
LAFFLLLLSADFSAERKRDPVFDLPEGRENQVSRNSVDPTANRYMDFASTASLSKSSNVLASSA